MHYRFFTLGLYLILLIKSTTLFRLHGFVLKKRFSELKKDDVYKLSLILILKRCETLEDFRSIPNKIYERIFTDAKKYRSPAISNTSMKLSNTFPYKLSPSESLLISTTFPHLFSSFASPSKHKCATLS